ncbi:MAG: hypothetical protein IRZ16_08610 [Myxococcaceae bacterium]|nr:hypothetical protein [Myxococcaceae bacterium]
MDGVVEGNALRTIFHDRRMGHVSVDAGRLALEPTTTATIDVGVVAGPWVTSTIGVSRETRGFWSIARPDGLASMS